MNAGMQPLLERSAAAIPLSPDREQQKIKR